MLIHWYRLYVFIVISSWIQLKLKYEMAHRSTLISSALEKISIMNNILLVAARNVYNTIKKLTNFNYTNVHMKWLTLLNNNWLDMYSKFYTNSGFEPTLHPRLRCFNHKSSLSFKMSSTFGLVINYYYWIL